MLANCTYHAIWVSRQADKFEDDVLASRVSVRKQRIISSACTLHRERAIGCRAVALAQTDMSLYWTHPGRFASLYPLGAEACLRSNRLVLLLSTWHFSGGLQCVQRYTARRPHLLRSHCTHSSGPASSALHDYHARARQHASADRPSLLVHTGCEPRSRPLRLPTPLQHGLLQERLQVEGCLSVRVKSRRQQRARCTAATMGRCVVSQGRRPGRDSRARPRLHTGDEVQRYAHKTPGHDGSQC